MGREGGAEPGGEGPEQSFGPYPSPKSAAACTSAKPPRFVFTKDDSAAYAVHIDQLLQDIEKAHPAAQAEPEEQE